MNRLTVVILQVRNLKDIDVVETGTAVGLVGFLPSFGLGSKTKIASVISFPISFVHCLVVTATPMPGGKLQLFFRLKRFG